jgi:O-antigen/teichoic acid export membrane protein
MRQKLYSVLVGVKSYGTILAASAAILVFDTGIAGTISAVIFVEVVFGIALQMVIFRKIGIGLPRWGYLKDSVEYSVPLTVSTFASNLSSRADKVIIGTILGAEAVGVYSVAYATSSILNSLVNPIRNSFFPEFSRLISENKSHLVRQYTNAGIRVFIILTIPGIAGLSILSGRIISIISKSYISTRVVNLIPVLCIGILLLGLSRLYATSLIASGDTKFVSIVRSVPAVGNVVLNIILLPVIGILGAALATAITYFVEVYIIKVRASNKFKIKFPFWSLWRCSLGAITMALILSLIKPSISGLSSSIVVILANMVTGAIIYFIVIYILGEISRNELDGIASSISSFLLTISRR